MRFVLALAVAAGSLATACVPPNPGGGECQMDRQCGDGEVCARDSLCAPATDVRGVTTTWTIRGAAATATSCATMPDLTISFLGRDVTDSLGFSPVPCEAGQFFIDKLPSRFREVELGSVGGSPQARAIGSNGTVTIDLR